MNEKFFRRSAIYLAIAGFGRGCPWPQAALRRKTEGFLRDRCLPDKCLPERSCLLKPKPAGFLLTS